MSASDVYATTIQSLPSTSEWTNRKLTAYDNNKAAALPNIEDLSKQDVCNFSLSNINSGNINVKSCIFMLERTTFAKSKVSDDLGPRSGVALQIYNNNYYRIQTSTLKLEKKDASSKNAARPVIEIPSSELEVVPPVMHTVNYDTQDGEPSSTAQIEHGEEIGELPVLPNRDEYVFMGWSTTSDGENIIDATYIVEGDITLYAVFRIPNYTALIISPVVSNPGKDTLQKAINAAESGIETTIVLLKDVNEAITINNNRNIKLEMRGHTINGAGSKALNISSGAIANLSDGSLSSTGSNTIDNYGALSLEDVEISCSAAQGAINNNGSGTLNIKDSNIVSTGGKQGIYNNGGALRIEGNTTISTTSTNRAAVHNKANNGSIVIAGGTITSTGGYAVYNQAGTLSIGVEGGNLSTTTPTIIGKTYGVVANAKYAMYDGIIKGETHALGTGSGDNPSPSHDSSASKLDAIEAGTERIIETQGEYEVLYLSLQNKYSISFNANGGTVSETNRTIDQGDEVGELPNPTRGTYIFDGWFTEAEGGAQIDEHTVPTKNVTYYAHWHFNSSNEIVSFNSYTPVIQEYFDSIAGWKDSEAATLDGLQNLFEGHD